MSHRFGFSRNVIALSIAVASLAASPVRAEHSAQPVRAGEASYLPAQNGPHPLVLAPAAPAAESCYTEYTGDTVTDFTSLDAQAVRDALAVVPSGGTIRIAGRCAGTSFQNGAFQVGLVTKTVTLVGGYTTTWTISDPIANPTTLDAMGGGRVIYAFASMTLSALSLINGSIAANDGGGVYAIGDLNLIDTQFLSNTAVNKGGGFVAFGTAMLSGGLFQNNRSTTDNGAGLYSYGSLTVSGTQFISNTAGNVGGGLNAATELTLTNSAFISNVATNGGGVNAQGTALVSGARFENNQVNFVGGGMSAVGRLTMTGTDFIRNAAGNGGGGLMTYSSTQISGGVIQDNRGLNLSASGAGIWATESIAVTGTRFVSNTTGLQGQGGGVYAQKAMSLTEAQFYSNTARLGGGAWATGEAWLIGGLFQGNRVTPDNGGGLDAESALTLSGTKFINNSAAQSGGAVYVKGAAILTDAFFSNNQATTYYGGALYAAEALTLTGGQFLSNTAGVYGGGVNAMKSVTTRLSPSTGLGTTFISNTVGNGYGGGLYAIGSVNLTGGLFQRNRLLAASSYGGGLYTNGSLALTDT